MHYEKFEVITAANGASSLNFELACATAIDHYTRCTGPQNKEAKSDHNTPCSTGLRVYEGAQVLAAFLAKFGRSLIPKISGDDSSEQSGFWVVELGCGCGLVGFTMASLFPEVSVAFTDASVDCLSLIAASAKRQNLFIVQKDGSDFPGVPEVNANRILLSCPLEWCEKDATELFSVLRRLSNSSNRLKTGCVRMILGSDLLYYRVDMKALLNTCKILLQLSQDESYEEGKYLSSVPQFVILTHFMRIPDGDIKLQMTAYELGFGVVRVPLEAFVSMDVVQSHGWNGISVVLLFLRSSACVESNFLSMVDSLRERREEEDLVEAKKIFCEGHLSLPNEALACYSKKTLGATFNNSLDCEGECGLASLPFLVV